MTLTTKKIKLKKILKSESQLRQINIKIKAIMRTIWTETERESRERERGEGQVKSSGEGFGLSFTNFCGGGSGDISN